MEEEIDESRSENAWIIWDPSTSLASRRADFDYFPCFENLPVSIQGAMELYRRRIANGEPPWSPSLPFDNEPFAMRGEEKKVLQLLVASGKFVMKDATEEQGHYALLDKRTGNLINFKHGAIHGHKESSNVTCQQSSVPERKMRLIRQGWLYSLVHRDNGAPLIGTFEDLCSVAESNELPMCMAYKFVTEDGMRRYYEVRNSFE